MRVEAHISPAYRESSRPEVLEEHARIDSSSSIDHQSDYHAWSTVELVEIGPPEADDGRVRAPSLLKKTEVGHGRDKSAIVPCIPYLNPVKHSA